MKKVFTFVAAALCAVAMSATSLYSVDFTKGQGSWTIDNKDISSLGYVWQQTDQYGMKASAYVKKAFAAESWLVSPAIDLTKATSATLTINQALNKGAATNLAVKVSSDDGANWDNLSISFPEGTSWNYQEDNANLNAYVGKTIKLAFAYVSTTSVCPTWQIKSVAIAGEGEGGEGGEGEDVVKKTYSMIEAYNYYDYWSEDGENITLYLYNSPDSEEYVQLDLIVPNGTGLSGIPAGTYTIDESYEAMSAVPGFYDEEYDEILGCWVFGEGDEDYWDLAEGTVTVQKSGSTYTLTIKATAWDETAFEITYTGEITVEDGKFVDAVENTEANVQSAIKTLRNGQVLIQKNNKVYTILGQEVK